MSTYFCLLTAIGQASIANAVALNQDVELSEMAVGDGDGSAITPLATMTELVNEVYRIPVNTIYIDPQDAGHVVAEMVIPSNQGGWTVREVGLFDVGGNLFAVGSLPDSVKPATGEGAGAEMTVRMHLTMSAAQAEAIELKIDPTVVLSTRQYVDESIATHAVDGDAHPDKADADHTHADKADVDHIHETNDVTDLLSAPHEWSKGQRYAQTLLDVVDGAVAWDMEAKPHAVLILDDDVTSLTVFNYKAGGTYELTILQDATGGRVCVTPLGVLTPGGDAWEIAMDAYGETLINFSGRADGATVYLRSYLSADFKAVV